MDEGRCRISCTGATPRQDVPPLVLVEAWKPRKQPIWDWRGWPCSPCSSCLSSLFLARSVPHLAMP